MKSELKFGIGVGSNVLKFGFRFPNSLKRSYSSNVESRVDLTLTKLATLVKLYPGSFYELFSEINVTSFHNNLTNNLKEIRNRKYY